MGAFAAEVTVDKKYIPNVVVKIGSTYYAARQPDSGLVIPSPYCNMVKDFTINPTAIDIKKVNTTVAGFSFRLVDLAGVATALIAGTGAGVILQDVTVWIGRSRVSSAFDAKDFTGYYQLPITKVRKIDHGDNSYSFTTSEDIDRMIKPVFDATSALAVDILAGTTVITMRDSINDFPTSGYVRVENEIFSYTTKDNTARTFSGVVRGTLGTTAANHAINTSCYQSQIVTDNPLTILLNILTSNGGGGTYDVLKDGLGISASLIDVTAIETIRDNLFSGIQIKLELSNVTSALKFIETEILQFFNLRFTYSDSAKLSLTVLDQAVFSPIVTSIDENSITTYPKWSVDDTKIVNALKIEWDYDEATGTFLKYSEPKDDASVALYGLRNPLTFSFRGIKSGLDGTALIANFARILFARLSTPVAEVEFKSHISACLQNIGAKVYVKSSKIPSPSGGLNFASDMEVTKRAINYQTGEVSFTYSYTSFTKIRSGYIAPSDTVVTPVAQNRFYIAAGRGAKYQVGWVMRLWNNLTNSYEADAPNTILSITTFNNLLADDGSGLSLDDGSGLAFDDGLDLITFQNNWSTTLTTNHRIRFANYSEVVETQKRYGFISNLGNNFADGKPTYKVTY